MVTTQMNPSYLDIPVTTKAKVLKKALGRLKLAEEILELFNEMYEPLDSEDLRRTIEKKLHYASEDEIARETNKEKKIAQQQAVKCTFEKAIINLKNLIEEAQQERVQQGLSRVIGETTAEVPIIIKTNPQKCCCTIC